MTDQSIDDFIADRLDEDLAAIAVKYLGEDAGLGQITAWVNLHKAAPDLLAALEELVNIVDGLVEDQICPHRVDSFTLDPARAAIARAKGD